MKAARRIAVASLIAFLILGTVSWIAGGQLIAAQPTIITPAPADLHAESVSIPTSNGQPVRGWWIQGTPGKASVLLLHGVRANRLAMVGRARALAARGYSVLLIDLQAHGESPGEAITLGLRESVGVMAARDWIAQRKPGGKIGVIGVSLGGASVLLGKMPCGFDAVVLEAVYSNVHRAIRNRLAIRFGPLAPALTPLLELQLQPRLGISPDQLDPIDHISELGTPVLIVAGGRDQHTNLDESEELFQRAKAPKSIWVLPQAVHQDFYRLDPEQYQKHVFAFLDHYLAHG